MQNLKNLQKKGERMDYERPSNCWYRNVCQIDACDHCIRYMEMSHLLENSGIPKVRQRPTTLVPDDADYNSFVMLSDIKDNILQRVEGGFNLYISSRNTGNGKTSWAIKIMLKYFDGIWAGNGFRVRGLFVHVPTLLSRLKDFDNPLSSEYRNSLLKADLIIWDDIAVSGISQYDYNNLLMYIDNRILNEKSNIFTSNKTSKYDLEEVIGNRLASRIWETSTKITLVGKDRRNG